MTTAKRAAPAHGGNRLRKLTPEQRDNAIRMLSNIVCEELSGSPASSPKNPNWNSTCPHCGSSNIRKRGRDSRKRQRYQCKNCKKSSTQDTPLHIASSKLPLEKWLLFIDCYVDFMNLRDTAKACGVCLKTAFNMRHRMLKAIQMHCPSSFAAFQAYGNEDEQHSGNDNVVRITVRSAPDEAKNESKRHNTVTKTTRIPPAFPRNQTSYYKINGDLHASEAETTNTFARICLNATIEHIVQNSCQTRFLASDALAEFIAGFRRTTNRYRAEYTTWLSWLYLIKIADSANRFSIRVVQRLGKLRVATANTITFKVSIEPFVRYWTDIVSGTNSIWVR